MWGIVPSTTVLMFPAASLGLMISGFAVGLALAPLAGLYGDVTRAIPMLAQFWMLLTPVVYPARTTGLAGMLATWNPIAPLIITARESLTGKDLSLISETIMVLSGASLLTLLGLICFRVAMPHLIARMGG
jgi:lipopolysaccharide transport system permease protein